MPTDSDVLCLRNGTLATKNETVFGSYGSTFVSLVIRCIKMFRLVVVVDLNRKKSTQLCSSRIANASCMGTWPLQLNWRKLATLMLGFRTVLHCFVGKEDSSAVNSESLEYQKWRVLRLQALLSFLATSCSRTCSSYCTKPRWSEQFACGHRR